MSRQALNSYRQVDLASAPKMTILDKLFARLLRDVEDAERAIAARDVKRRAAALDHALRIVTELNAALDHKAAPALCANLASLYDYVVHCFHKASIASDAKPLAAARQVIDTLRASFSEAAAAA